MFSLEKREAGKEADSGKEKKKKRKIGGSWRRKNEKSRNKIWMSLGKRRRQ